MRVWGKSMAGVSARCGGRQQPSALGASVPDSTGLWQPEMSLVVLKGTWRAGGSGPMSTEGLIVFHQVQEGHKADPHNETGFLNVAGEAGKSSLEAEELCQGESEGQHASAIPKSRELELEKLANTPPFPSLTVVRYSLFLSVAGFQRCRQQDFCRFLWQSVSQPIRPLPYSAYVFSSLLRSVVYWMT